jgi:hypothetical protein
MPFEKNNTYGKNNKRGLGKNKEAIKEYLVRQKRLSDSLSKN